ncbi:hypothetical protein CC86DRAFT_62004 [Ophiobolus disseminans]|uniref:RNase MRP protein 1 RNA binding domain-containing protein n=1 Tax=Ophiobolus disseminans TaxID=1469910 RepID=A0A6A6ZS84_9PLEO|nr:hypothetical protein CC86DRAFT_62004 [Ophiobolus disseminans]
MAVSTTVTMPPSTITATTLLNAPPHDIAMLHDVHELLNKLFIRNKNQHRRSHWWKSLHAFRKQLGLLLHDLEAKKKDDVVEARLVFWDGCVHAWYYQFSQLVAVGSFAMLGLVMMASVARVCRIVGITDVYEEIASADIQGVLSANDELALANEFSSVLDRDEEWDEGVVVSREE